MSRIGSTTNFHQPDRRRMTCKYREQAVTSFQKNGNAWLLQTWLL